MKTRIKLLMCSLLLLLQPAVTMTTAVASRSTQASAPGAGSAAADVSNPETLLVAAIDEIRLDRPDAALAAIDRLLAAYPNFRLAHLIKGDLLLARTQPLAAFGGAQDAKPEQINDLRQEALARLQRYREQPPAGRIPKYLVQMLPEQRYAVVVDASRSRLYLYQNQDGVPRFVADYYITIGKNGAGKNKEGDKLTPVGVYFVTGTLPKEKLTDFYGPIAFPINYPNEWDRQLGRDGHGIWLHGTPSDTYSRPPRASDGCVVLANSDISAISRYMQAGLTPVVISDSVEWVDEAEWKNGRDTLAKEVETWRQDWEGRNAEAYLSHYSPTFQSEGQKFATWSEQKRKVNAGKTWIDLKLNKVSIFRYPGREQMAVVTFEQDYRSNNLNNRMRKRQYWKQEGQNWKIIFEGAA